MTDQSPPPESEEVPQAPTATESAHEKRILALLDVVVSSGPREAFEALEGEPDELVAQVLARENPPAADEILWEFPDERRTKILAAAPPEQREQWIANHTHPEDTIGRTMEPPAAVFRPNMTVAQAVEKLRELVKRVFVTYIWVTDDARKLVGVVAFRELLFARDEQTLEELMIRNPFALRPDMPVPDAMHEVVKRHYPVYPVTDAATGRLLGVVRGQTLFEQQAIEISAQPGAMVGVEKEERLATPLARSLKFRHPWLQLNLLTAFVAAAVVGIFEDTIDRVVVLAVFLPVLAGQSGNTGCQALAVALRAMTLGELEKGREKAVVLKEGMLGLANGALVGISASVGMYIYATISGADKPLMLSLVVWLAMIGACVTSGICGAIVPMTLRRLGADPATASSIFLTTATDVVSMGLFLSLATALVL